MKVGALISSGKDSNFAMYKVMKEHEVVCLMTIHSNNPDSYMFQSQGTDMVLLQAEALGLPLIEDETKGIKEEELIDLKRIIQKAIAQYDIETVVTGALYSDYQRERIENICEKLGIKSLAPLWHMGQEKEMKELLKEGFKFIFVKIAADGLNKDWLGNIITQEHLDKLMTINEKIGLNIAGEGGEFESLVLDSPIYKKRIVIDDSEIKMENDYIGLFLINKSHLEEK